MKRSFPVLLAVLALILSSLACEALSTEMSVKDLRMAHDQDGEQVTTTYAATDIFYAVADLSNAPLGTVVKANWVAVDVADTEPNLEFQQQTIDITEESFSGTIYFQLSNDDGWPAGRYRVDISLNDVPAESIEFNVQ